MGRVEEEDSVGVGSLGGAMAGAMLVCCWKYVGLLGVVVVMGGERVIGRYELRQLICEEGDLVVRKGYLVWLSQELWYVRFMHRSWNGRWHNVLAEVGRAGLG